MSKALTTSSRWLAAAALLGLAASAFAAGGDVGQTTKQATNWIAIGMFVAFVAGTDPRTMTFARVCPAPPIPGSLARLPAGRHETVAGQALGGDAALWAASDGIWLGLPGGVVKRLAAA